MLFRSVFRVVFWSFKFLICSRRNFNRFFSASGLLAGIDDQGISLKYPHLKDDEGCKDWILKMKRQLIADNLWRVATPNWTIAKDCAPGADTELGDLQLNYFEQILSAVLQNPEGKGLTTTHPEDSLYVWIKTAHITNRFPCS